MKRYLWKDRHGRWRVRKGGRTWPLRDEKGAWHEPDTPEGDRLYWEIVTGKRAEAKRSWAAAFDLVRASDRWAALSPRYRRDLEPVMNYLVEKIGKRDVGRLTQADIYAAMDANKHRVRFANYIPVVISLTFKVIVRRRWLTDNPAAGVELLKVPVSRRAPHVPWTPEAAAKMRAEGHLLPRLIFELGVGSVQRPGDLVAFTWADYDGEALRLTQNKTGKELFLPCSGDLKAVLAEWRASLPYTPLPSQHILSTAQGGRMSYHTLARTMRTERRRLGVERHDLHAMRYLGVMELAWAGCDDDEIMSFSGHATKAMVAKYAGIARQIMRATTAAEKRRLWSSL